MPSPNISLLGDSIIDPQALNFPEGPWGTCINGQSFQLPAITSFKGWQYAAYFEARGHPALARRKLPDGEWQRIVFTDYQITHNNIHNVAVVGICPGDGTIHLTFDQHGGQLRYRVSRRGAALQPDTTKWEIDLFTPTRDELMTGEPLKGITYPAFFARPDGKMQFYFRTGGSGHGDSNLAEYDPATGTWQTLGIFVHRRGEAHGYSSRNAYHNGFTYDAHGRLHTTWCWRTHWDSLLRNHDLMYAVSDDFGRTWRNSAGNVIGKIRTDPIDMDKPGVIAHPIPYGQGMMNQTTQDIDSRGGVHTVMWHTPPGAAASIEPNDWKYFHYRRHADGSWSRHLMPFTGTRPSMLVDKADNLYLIFTSGEQLDQYGRDPGRPICIATATAGSEWSDWSIVHRSNGLADGGLFDGEPRVDRERWRDEGVISVYAQSHPRSSGAPSALREIDYTVA